MKRPLQTDVAIAMRRILAALESWFSERGIDAAAAATAGAFACADAGAAFPPAFAAAGDDVPTRRAAEEASKKKSFRCATHREEVTSIVGRTLLAMDDWEEETARAST